MFLLKKVLSQFFYPLPLALTILVLGLVCLWTTRRQRLGKALVTLGTFILLLASMAFLPTMLSVPLERGYPALLDPAAIAGSTGQAVPPPKWIVVLGGGHVSDPNLPANSQISDVALARLVEGIRLHRALPGSKLLLSGGGGFDPVPEAEVMGRIAAMLGVRPEDLVLERDSQDTADQAALIAKMLGREKIILVTSASHMTRSMALFKKQGLSPIPAPANFALKQAQGIRLGDFMPGPGNLALLQTALHEYLGLAWAWLRGVI
jgi:uncharacterized SAM-binding protein YcdF (DUF218 family)